jgi:hypothetical protein
MFTTAALARTSGAAPAAVACAATAPAVVSSTSVVGKAWYRPITGIGFWMNHTHRTRRPPSPNS